MDLRSKGKFWGTRYWIYAAIAPLLDQENAVWVMYAQGIINTLIIRAVSFTREKMLQRFAIIGKPNKAIKEPIAALVSKKTGSSALDLLCVSRIDRR